MDSFDELIKSHYAARRLPESTVGEILRSCEGARAIYRWKRVAIAAISVAAASLVALGVTLVSMGHPGTTEPNLVSVAPDSARISQQLVAVRIHADDCARSQQMAPIFDGLQKEFADAPVLFVTFDRSSGAATQQTRCLSKILGIETVFEKCARTGQLVVASPDGVVQDILDSKDGLLAACETVRSHLH